MGDSSCKRAGWDPENASNEWYTPREWIELAQKAMACNRIELDPASNAVANAKVRAQRYFSLARGEDALELEWRAETLWLNPPFSHGMMLPFSKMLVSSVKKGHVQQAVVLTHSRTDTRWFSEYALNANAMCFTTTRIKFWNPKLKEGKGGANCGQVFFYFGDAWERFRDTFSDYALVVRKADAEEN